MSDSARSSTILGTADKTTSRQPRAIVHKQILEVAKKEPDASVTQIAAQVSGASITLVERVLNEYAESFSTASKVDNKSTDRVESNTDVRKEANSNYALSKATELSSLTVKQQQTLSEIYKQPDATQGDLAEIFDVDRTSISHRLNNITGFRWERRHEFVNNLFEEHHSKSDIPDEESTTSKSSTKGCAASLEQDIDEDTVTPISDHDSADYEESAFTLALDLTLARKLLQVCFESEDITKEEEFKLLEGLISSSCDHSDN